MQIILVKQTDAELSEADAPIVRRFLFEHFSGATEKDTKAWNRFWRGMNKCAAGEYVSIKLERPRQSWRHRKHMKMISDVFKSQERLEDFEQFRLWLKVGSGFVTWLPGPKGGVFPVPKSINFNECSEDEFVAYDEGVRAFLRTEHAAKYLFPDVAVFLAERGIEKMLSEYEKDPQA